MIYRRVFGLPAWEQRNPHSEIERMRRQMERLFEGWAAHRSAPAAGVFPPVNLTESREAFTARAELPGVATEDVDIQATANTLSIGGRRRIPEENGSAKYHRREREAGGFSRVIGLPGDISPEKVEAGMKNGILTVVMPRAEAAKPKQINVR